MACAWEELREGFRFLKDCMLERHYRERGPAYFARLLRRARVLGVEEVMALLEAASRARELRVWQLTDGRMVVPEA